MTIYHDPPNWNPTYERLYSHTDDLDEIFVGRRIVKAEIGVPDPGVKEWYRGTEPYGRLTLDNGTEVYAVGNDGGCVCSAGCYALNHVAATDNIITAVKVIADPAGDEYETDDYDKDGRYQIFVVTEAKELNIAEFVGTDGNGYYGTGFHIVVIGTTIIEPLVPRGDADA